MDDVFLKVRGLSKTYRNGPKVLDKLDLDVRGRDRIVVIGPSGGGKSTLLRCLMGLEDVDQGSITFEGRDYVSSKPGSPTRIDRSVQRQIGMVFQSYTLFPHLTVMRNLTLAPVWSRRRDRKEAEARAEDLLRRFGLSAKLKAYPSQLSGGQKQRVAIARALMLDPKLMLFDEVTSALDPELVVEVEETMTQLADQGMPMIIVTHDMHFGRSIATRLLFCAGGRIEEDVQASSPLDEAAHPRTSAFLKRMRAG